MSRLVLHAGLPKTGTTSFQAFAWHNREKLAARGVAYCDGFRGRNHTEIAIAYSHRVTPLTRSYGVHSDDDRQELLRRLPSMLGDPSRATAVFASSEHLTNLVYKPRCIETAAESLHTMFDEVIVVMVVRRSDYWTPSMYSESIKAGGPRPFGADFVERHRRLLDHAELFANWRAAFGDENVLAVPFLETDKSDPTILPARLLGTAGVALDDLDLAEGAPQMQNTSLSAYAIELLRRMNSERADTPLKNLNWRYRVIPIARQHWPGPSQRVTPEAAAKLAELGWVRTGVGEHQPDSNGLWPQWSGQHDAETMSPPMVSDEDLERFIDMLRRQELLDRTWSRITRARARRLGRRLLRR